MQQACSSKRIQEILQQDRCLFHGIEIEDVSIPLRKDSINTLAEIEALEHPTNEQLLRVMNDRGTFRSLSSCSDKKDSMLVYTPNTLPYNKSAPLRNTVPYIPLDFNEKGVSISPVLPEETFNPSVVEFVKNRNAALTEEQLQEYALIRKELKLDTIRSELNHLGSVIEDDVKHICTVSHRLSHSQKI